VEISTIKFSNTLFLKISTSLRNRHGLAALIITDMFCAAFTGFETANKYSVKNSLGQKVYFAAEDTDCCTRSVKSNKKCDIKKLIEVCCTADIWA